MHSSLGQLIKILRQTQMEVVVDKLIDFSGGKDEELRDISALGALCTLILFYFIDFNTREALKTITAELPPDGRIAQSACSKLTPKLLGQLANVRATLFHSIYLHLHRYISAIDTA
jgi:cullin-associated NEDD8-dissociated protein 1